MKHSSRKSINAQCCDFVAVDNDNLPRDHNVYCKRNNGETYAVLTPSAWRRLRTQEKLDAYLKSRRE